MSERLLIIRSGEWPPGRRVWPHHTNTHEGPLNGRKSAAAVFSREGGAWRCVRAVPPLMTWLTMPMEDIKSLLAEKGLRFEWARRFEL